jgi:membrane protein implicated in regulation of membrane protease activity
MNKRINTLLFILGATAFNIIITVLSFLGLTFLYIKLIIPLIPEANHPWGFVIIVLASLAVSFVVYRFLFKYLLKKIDVDKYFDPLFGRKYRK